MFRLICLRFGLFGLWLWALMVAPYASAQWQGGGALGGQVLDAQAMPIVHAQLLVESDLTGTSYSLHSDRDGGFLLAGLAPGSYSLTVEAFGYAKARAEVSVTANHKVNLVLHLARTFKPEGLNQPRPAQPLVVIVPAQPAARSRVASPSILPSASLDTSDRLEQIKHQASGWHLRPRPPVPARSLLAYSAPGSLAEVPRAFAEVRPAPEASKLAPLKFAPSASASPVHARISIRSPQGMVQEEITEQPSALATASPATSYFAHKPNAQDGTQASVPQSAAVVSSVPSVPALDESMQVAQPGFVVAPSPVAPRPSTASLEALASAFAPVSAHAEQRGSARPMSEQTKNAELQVSWVESEPGAIGAEISRPLPSVAVDLSRLKPTSEGSGVEPFSAFRPTHAELNGQMPESEREANAALTVVEPAREAQIHGQVFVEDRNSDWGAQNSFTQLTQPTATGTFISTPYKPPDRQLQGGLELGEEFAHRRFYWFVAVDGLERNHPGMAIASDPKSFFASLSASELNTLSGRLGLASAGDAEKEYQQAMTEVSTLLGSVPRSTHQWIALPRFDWRLNARNHISIGYDWVHLRAHNGVQSAPTETWGTGSFGTRELSLDAVSAEWNSFLSSNVLNQLRYTLAHDEQSQLADSPTAFEQQFAHNVYGLAPEVSLASYSGGFSFGTPSYLNKAKYPDELRQEAADTLTWEHGHSQINLGYALQYVRDQITGASYGAGAYRYSSRQAFIADLLNPNHCDASTSGSGNLPCWESFQQTVGPNSFAFDTADYAGFATLTQRIGTNLTLSVSARYDEERLPHPNTVLINPSLAQTASLPSGGNLSPRAGFAWALPWLSHRAGVATVLRGGAGVFYARIPNTSVYNAISQTGVAKAERNYTFKPLDVGAPAFPYVFGDDPDIQIAPNAIYFARGFEHPRATEVEVSIEQSLGANTTLTAGYWGSFASHLPRLMDENIDTSQVAHLSYTVVDPNHKGPLPEGQYASKFFYRRLNANYQQLAAIESTVAARYQAVGLTLKSRLPHAMTLLLSYRNSHTLDGNPYSGLYSGYWNVLDPSDTALDWGTSSLDLRNRVRGELVLRTPWDLSGWRGVLLSGYTLSMAGGYASGRPYSMRTTGAVPSFSCSYQEWLQYGNNCVQFALPGIITGGSVAISGLGDSLNGAGGAEWIDGVGRNTYRYPSTYTANLHLRKSTSLGRGKALVMGAQVTNFMNHKNITRLETAGYSIRGESTATGMGRLTYLDGSDGYSAFGQPTTSNNNEVYRDRQVEVILRLIF